MPPLELTPEQAERFELLKAGKWHGFPLKTSVPMKKEGRK